MKMRNLNEHLDEVQEKIDYYFNNTDLLLQAFTRSSYSTQYGGENNEVLEFIGDKVLDLYVVKTIVDKFGFMKSQSEYYDTLSLSKRKTESITLIVFTPNAAVQHLITQEPL